MKYSGAEYHSWSRGLWLWNVFATSIITLVINTSKPRTQLRFLLPARKLHELSVYLIFIVLTLKEIHSTTGFSAIQVLQRQYVQVYKINNWRTYIRSLSSLTKSHRCSQKSSNTVWSAIGAPMFFEPEVDRDGIFTFPFPVCCGASLVSWNWPFVSVVESVWS